MRKLTMTVAALALGAATVSAAGTATWTIDPAHSTARFRVRHLMISNVEGRFGKVTGTIHFDENDVSKSSVEATIDTTTVDTGAENRDEHLKSADFFDVKEHPTMTFKSTKVESAGDGELKVTGELTIRGVTQPVVLDVQGPSEPILDPWGNVKAGASATTSINRQDFGVAWNKSLDAGGVVVGDTVEVTIEIEMAKAKQEPEG